jgi:hypothetical protein
LDGPYDGPFQIVRLQAGVADPNDASHFTIDFDVPGWKKLGRLMPI